MKYQALRSYFFSVVGGWRVLGVGGWVVVVVWMVGWVGVFWWGGVGGEGWGWWVGRWGGGVVGSGWVGDVMGSGWGGGVHLIGKIILSLEKNNMGASDTPNDAPMLFFDNLGKKLDNLSTSNIDIYPSTMKICINNLLRLFFFGSGPPHPHPQTLPETNPPP